MNLLLFQGLNMTNETLPGAATHTLIESPEQHNRMTGSHAIVVHVSF